MQEQEIQVNLKRLNEHSNDCWQLNSQGHLIRHFVFKDFVEAFGFISQIAVIAEKLDHHPNLSNVYNKVDIELYSHDIESLSERDFQLARAIEDRFSQSI